MKTSFLISRIDMGRYYQLTYSDGSVFNVGKEVNTKTNKRNYIYVKLKSHIKLCEICGSNKSLQVHHINKNKYDNDYENLIKLCNKCHCEQHKGDNVYKLMLSSLNVNG